jgi:hypothetical protein
MKKLVKTVAIGILSAASVTLGAQSPQSAPTPQPPDNRQPTITQTPTRAQPANPTMTVSGCLLKEKEKDVDDVKPNVTERTGVTEDYILTDVKMSPSSSVSGIAVSTRYEIEGIAEAELQKHLNHHVELTGQITQTEATSSDITPPFRATSLKMLAATCGTGW